MDYVYAGSIGLLLGGTEIAARYRDNPWKALANFSAILYVLSTCRPVVSPST